MKHHLPPLEGLKVFESAARHLSFSIAADELCITKGAVSYQIRKLESHLQCELFKRKVRQVYLTDSGQMLLQTTQGLFTELSDTLDRLQVDGRQAGVTVAVSTYVAARWLSRHISAFNAHYPGVNVMLRHSVNAADFSLSEVDLAIRWGPCRSNFTRNQFGQIPMALYPVASSALLKKHNLKPAANVETSLSMDSGFHDLPLLCEDRPQDLWQEWINASSNNVAPSLQAPAIINPRRTISDANVRVQAAVDGQGLILADEMMANEINSGQLIRPYKQELHGYGYAFLSSTNRIQGRHAKALKEWLSTCAAPAVGAGHSSD